MLRTSSARLLDDRDLPAVREVLAGDPVANVFVTSRIEAAGLESWRLGAEVWGFGGGRGLDALCYAGANLVPVAGPGNAAAAVRAFVDRARRQGRRCSSIVGAAHLVDPMWEGLRATWGRAREVRRQPLLATSRPAACDPDPHVRRLRADELELVLPAAVAMVTEEIGLSPTDGDGGELHRARVAELVAGGRTFARVDDGRVVFKADLGAVTAQACQVQGVWVDPALRGRGLGTAGMAAVVNEALRSVAPVVSLYVNDFNTAARASYRTVGFGQIGEFVSVLF